MAFHREQAIQHVRENRPAFLKDLEAVIRIPSISASEENKPDMRRTAEWIAARLTAAGCENAQVLTTAGHPVVYADYLKAGEKVQTVLIYGHYDVQPPDPLDLWTNPPFEPVYSGDYLLSRGASDMKGQMIATIAAVEAIIKQGDCPVNFKFMIEGEEEIGSPSLTEWMKNNKDLISCDVVLNPDAGMIAPDIPTIVYGLRGLAYFEIRVHGPDHDLHSGVFGGAVLNPAQALCDLIAGMHDSDGRVTLPGFYDSVIPLSYEEKVELARLPLTDESYIEQTGVPALHGEAGYTNFERIGARPTLEVNGLYSGYIGKGSKTVIPSYAMAKVSMRLVPNQVAGDVYQQLLAYLAAHTPNAVRYEVIRMPGGPAYMADINHPATQSLHSALKAAWGKDPVYKREGGSVPIVADIKNVLGVESICTGFGLPSDNIHSPNEHLHVPTWATGIEALVYFFYNMGTE